MDEFKLDFSYLQKAVERSQDRIYVKGNEHMIKRFAFDLVRMDSEPETLWKVQADDDGNEFLVRTYTMPEDKEAAASDWSVDADKKQANLTVSYKGAPLHRLVAAEYGACSPDEADLLAKVLRRKLAVDSEFAGKLLASLPVPKLRAVAAAFPELKIAAKARSKEERAKLCLPMWKLIPDDRRDMILPDWEKMTVRQIMEGLVGLDDIGWLDFEETAWKHGHRIPSEGLFGSESKSELKVEAWDPEEPRRQRPTEEISQEQLDELLHQTRHTRPTATYLAVGHPETEEKKQKFMQSPEFADAFAKWLSETAGAEEMPGEEAVAAFMAVLEKQGQFDPEDGWRTAVDGGDIVIARGKAQVVRLAASKYGAEMPEDVELFRLLVQSKLDSQDEDFLRAAIVSVAAESDKE